MACSAATATARQPDFARHQGQIGHRGRQIQLESRLDPAEVAGLADAQLDQPRQPMLYHHPSRSILVVGIALPEGGRKPVTPGDYITVANHDPRVPASARFRGRITEVSGPNCTFVIEEAVVDPDWPTHIHPMGQGNAVYLALPGSFLPHPFRAVQNQAEWDMLLQLAADHQDRTGIPPSGAIITPAHPHLPDQQQP